MTRKEQADVRATRKDERGERFKQALTLAVLHQYNPMDGTETLTWVQIAARVGVTVRTLSRWRTAPEWLKAEERARSACHRRFEQQLRQVRDKRAAETEARLSEYDQRVRAARQKAGRARWGR